MLPCLESLTLYLIQNTHSTHSTFQQKKYPNITFSYTFFTLSPSNITITPTPNPLGTCKVAKALPHSPRSHVCSPSWWRSEDMVPGRRKKIPHPHRGTRKRPPTHIWWGLFESFTKDQWTKNLELALLAKKTYEKMQMFTQRLVLEDAAVGRSTIKYTLFSRGRTKTHHPSRKSWVLSKLLGGGGVFQPSPTNTWFVELQPIPWKFGGFFQIPSAWMSPKKRCETS